MSLGDDSDQDSDRGSTPTQVTAAAAATADHSVSYLLHIETEIARGERAVQLGFTLNSYLSERDRFISRHGTIS